MKIKGTLLAAMGLMLLWSAMATATPQRTQREHALKVGKKGEITLTKPTKVGDKTLLPDTYVVQHRVSKTGDHFVRFIELKQVEAVPPTEIQYTYTEEDNAGEIKCRIEPAPGPIKETRLYTVTENGVPRITKVAIKGENVFHVF